MNKTQKTFLVTAAITGLVAGAVAKARTTDNNQNANLAGKQVASHTAHLTDSCAGKGCCSSKTNKTSALSSL